MPPKRPAPKRTAKKPAPSPSRAPKKAGGKGRGRSGARLYLWLLLAALLLGGLLWLARRADRETPELPVKPTQPAATRVDQSGAAREQVEAFLAATAVPAESVSREPAEFPHHYQVHHRRPAGESVDKLRQRLRQLAPPLALSIPEDGVLVIVDSQGKSLVTIQYLPAAPVPPKAVNPPVGKGGRVAIIVDDLGRGTQAAKQLLAIDEPVTFAVLPGEAQAADVARMAHAAGREVMLHTPMEPQGFPVVDPGDDALLTGQGDDELKVRLRALLDRVPHASGANNHMGSRFTEDERAMNAVMAVLKERGLFFIDSLTSSNSVAVEAARRAGVPVLRRDVFLDNVAEVGPITVELRRLAEKARRNGHAVGICHPYPETLQALRQELPKLARQGVVFVKLSDLMGSGG